MGNNIIRWENKKIKDLIFPTNSLFKSDRKDLHPKVKIGQDYKAKIKYFGETFVTGTIEHGFIDGESVQMFRVNDIDITGEGSSTFMEYSFDDALKASTGKLHAWFILESAEIQRLKVKDGIYERTEITDI